MIHHPANSMKKVSGGYAEKKTAGLSHSAHSEIGSSGAGIFDAQGKLIGINHGVIGSNKGTIISEVTSPILSSLLPPESNTPSEPPQPLRITITCGGEDEPFCVAGHWAYPWEFTFTASGGDSSKYRWSHANGNLPTFSSLNEETGVLSGSATWWFGLGWHFDIIVSDGTQRASKYVYFKSTN